MDGVSSQMERRASIDPILQSLDLLLKLRGYRRKDHTFRKLENDLWLIIDVQSATGSTPRAVDVTINLGVFVPRLEDAEVEPSVWSAHWRQRIGYLMPEARDVWWIIDSEEKAKAA